MTAHIPWQLAIETVAYVPRSLGFTPTDSVAIVTYTFREGFFYLGSTVRFDLEIFTDPRGHDFAIHSLDRLAEVQNDGAVVVLYGDRDKPSIARALAVLTAAWPFAEHGGAFHVDAELISAINDEGRTLATRDLIEVAGAVVTRELATEPVMADESGLRFSRSPMAGDEEEKLNAELAALSSVREVALWSRSLKRTYQQGSVESAKAALACAFALDVPRVRDSFLGWVMEGACAPGPIYEFDGLGAFGTLDRPEPEVVKSALAALSSIAKPLPEGSAASPIACAAFLSWLDGRGAPARVLAQQAMEERPGHSLARLVLDLLAAGCPPPWMPRHPLPWSNCGQPIAS